MQTKIMPKKVKPKLGKIKESSKKKTRADSNILTLDEMFDKFMTAKKTEGLASRAIDEYYNMTMTGRHGNQGTIWLEKDLRKEIIKEAAELGRDVAEYIRGILFSLNQKLMLEAIAERERQAKIKHDNRVLAIF